MLPHLTTIPSEFDNISPQDPRLDPGYYAYYYSQRPLDPRLPPPLILPWSRFNNFENANEEQEFDEAEGKGSPPLLLAASHINSVILEEELISHQKLALRVRKLLCLLVCLLWRHALTPLKSLNEPKMLDDTRLAKIVAPQPAQHSPLSDYQNSIGSTDWSGSEDGWPQQPDSVPLRARSPTRSPMSGHPPKPISLGSLLFIRFYRLAVDCIPSFQWI